MLTIIVVIVIAFGLQIAWKAYQIHRSVQRRMKGLTVEECNARAQSNLLAAVDGFLALGEDFDTLAMDTIKYKEAMKLRPNHVPTILCCINAAELNATFVSKSSAFEEGGRKHVASIVARLNFANLPINKFLFDKLGRKVSDNEQDEVRQMLDRMIWDSTAKTFVLQ